MKNGSEGEYVIVVKGESEGGQVLHVEIFRYDFDIDSICDSTSEIASLGGFPISNGMAAIRGGPVNAIEKTCGKRIGRSVLDLRNGSARSKARYEAIRSCASASDYANVNCTRNFIKLYVERNECSDSPERFLQALAMSDMALEFASETVKDLAGGENGSYDKLLSSVEKKKLRDGLLSSLATKKESGRKMARTKI